MIIMIMIIIIIIIIDVVVVVIRIYSINRPGRLLNFWTLRVGAY